MALRGQSCTLADFALFSQDEVALLRLFDLHELSAAWILDRCDLATFLGLTAEERELAFGPVVGSDRLVS